MSDKHAPGPDARLPEAGPHTILDNENPDKSMPFAGAILLYQLPAPANGLAFSRPFIATSVDSVRQLVSGWLLPDMRLDGTSSFTFLVDVPFGTAGQSGTWHWPIKTYTGRSDAPGLTRVDNVEHTAEVPVDANSGATTAPLELPGKSAEQVAEDEGVFAPADTDKDGEISAKERKRYKKDHPEDNS